MAAERTEQATPRRREEARKRGDIPRSVEVNSAVSLLTAWIVLFVFGAVMVERMMGIMRWQFQTLDREDMSFADLRAMTNDLGMEMFSILLPLIGLLMLVGFVVGLGQSGFQLSLAGLKPQPQRLNPAAGLKRIFGLTGLGNLAKSILKLIIIGGATWMVLRDRIQEFGTYVGSDYRLTMHALADTAWRLGLTVGGIFLILAIVDYALTRWNYARRLRMTRQEVKEETKQSEGNRDPGSDPAPAARHVPEQDDRRRANGRHHHHQPARDRRRVALRPRFEPRAGRRRQGAATSGRPHPRHRPPARDPDRAKPAAGPRALSECRSRLGDSRRSLRGCCRHPCLHLLAPQRPAAVAS
ncbi:MAG: EscU/YscU/HrcU family type III secretion system export apparatus switch protein [Thermomicrobiales bacterium]